MLCVFMCESDITPLTSVCLHEMEARVRRSQGQRALGAQTVAYAYDAGRG